MDRSTTMPRTDAVPLPAEIGLGEFVELATHRAEPTIHVDAVIRIADGRVELRQLLPALAKPISERFQETPHGRAIERAHRRTQVKRPSAGRRC